MNPLITALCVSHPSRFGLLQRAIVNFVEQTYENKELLIVVVAGGYRDMIQSFLADKRLDLKGARIEVVTAPYRQPLEGAQAGMLRACGEYVACWDDDNLSHPDRLAFQVERTQDVPTCFSESMYYFYDSDELYITNYAQPTGEPHMRCAIGSLLLHRRDWPLYTQQGEQRPWAISVLSALAPQQRYQFISGFPQYFLAGSNTDNWRPEQLHRRLGSQLPLTWTRSKLESRQDDVASWVQLYQLPKHEIAVCGKDAQAFEVPSVYTSPDWFEGVMPPDDWHARIPNQEHQKRLNEERQEQQQQEQQRRQQQRVAQEPPATQTEKP